MDFKSPEEMEELAKQRLEFENRLEEHMLKNLCKQRRDKYVITRRLKNTALSLLKVKKGEKCIEGARIKFWVHEKFYAQGSVLKCKKTHKPVVVKEDLFNVIHESHCRSGHLKAGRTWNMLYKKYAYIKRDVVHVYIATCKICRPCLLLSSPSPQPMAPRQHSMTRVAVSVINMEDMPDCGYSFILLIRDCGTKFVTAWPMRDVGEDLLTCLLQHFGQFGPARYVHFVEAGVASELAKMKKLWPDLVVLEGCDDYPEIAEMSERMCADIQNKLGAWMAEVDSDSWSKGLGPSVFLMNSAITWDIPSFVQSSPFQSVFGKPPRQPDIQWKAVAFHGYTKETDLPERLREAKKELVVKKDDDDDDETKNSSSDDDDSQHREAPLCKITNIQSGATFWTQEDTELNDTDHVDLEISLADSVTLPISSAI